MIRPLFRPTPKEILVLALSGATALGFALAMRYLAIENTPLGLACDAGDRGLLCSTRTVVIRFSQASLFGAIALAAAVIHFARPTLALLWISLVTASLGLVLYNTPASAVAVAFLAFSLARPSPEPE